MRLGCLAWQTRSAG